MQVRELRIAAIDRRKFAQCRHVLLPFLFSILGLSCLFLVGFAGGSGWVLWDVLGPLYLVGRSHRVGRFPSSRKVRPRGWPRLARWGFWVVKKEMPWA
jgi:nitrate reductase NapE component